MPFSGWYGVGFSFGEDAGAGGGLSEDDLQLLILSLLADDGPARGYELALALEERSDGGIHADPELVYPLLQLLVDRELTSSRAPEGEKRIYEISQAGRERVEGRRRRIGALWRRARLAGGQFDEDVFEAAMGSACYSVRSALQEVGRALDEVMEGVFGSCCGGRTRRRGRWSGHRGPGCC